jgi:hypothetical protein
MPESICTGEAENVHETIACHGWMEQSLTVSEVELSLVSSTEVRL